MLNAQPHVRTLDEPPEHSASPAPVLITEREVALGTTVALQALCIPINISGGGLGYGWSVRQQT
jgi:hypothetical protein